jgi:hypothetical protein
VLGDCEISGGSALLGGAAFENYHPTVPEIQHFRSVWAGWLCETKRKQKGVSGDTSNDYVPSNRSMPQSAPKPNPTAVLCQ